MRATEVVLVCALDRSGVIGRDGGLPWRLPDDLKHFKALTLGKPCIMGRRTANSLGRPLPGRTNIVLTRSPFPPAGLEPGFVVVRSKEEALATALNCSPPTEVPAPTPEVLVIGGAEVYAAFLADAARIEFTEVDADVPGDTRFPAFDRGDWLEVSRHPHPADTRHEFPFAFVTLRRRSR